MTNFSKIYVLDTNVVVHDPGAVEKFEENEVVLPITVIEELDSLKKGQGEIPYSARQALRIIDSYRNRGNITKGVGLPGGGRLRVETRTSNGLPFGRNKPDDRIIGTALLLKKKHEGRGKGDGPRQVILVSKDTAVRIKGQSLGVRAEDFRTDKTTLFQQYGHLLNEREDVNGIRSVRYMRSGEGIYRLYGDGLSEEIRRERAVSGIRPQNPEQECAVDALLSDGTDVVALTGKAGSGKTLLALAAGLHLCEKSHPGRRVDKVVVVRPTVPVGGNDMGFLPGELDEKMRPWAAPVLDNLDIIVETPEHVKDEKRASRYRSSYYLLENGLVQVQPITYVRGRSLFNSFFIIDEAQQLRPLDIKTLLTRAGRGTKVVLCGDMDQIDTPYLDATSNGLAYLISRFINDERFCYLRLQRSARSPLADKAAEIL